MVTTSMGWKDLVVLITGVCGTVGRELLKQVLDCAPGEVVGIDNDETGIFFLSEEFRSNPNVRLYLGDVRDRDGLLRRAEGVSVILHAAAFKHVILCERSPSEALQTNIVGTQNVIDAAISNRVRRVIFMSSDKAVNPTNVMGTSKLMGERLITAANALHRSAGSVLASTRFGNVLGSSGSVMPVFQGQIRKGGPVTLTDVSMTRFVMTLQDAVRLVMESVFLARGGEVFVTKMPVVRIVDLAQVMIEELAPHYGHDPAKIKVELIGSKPGEKMFEELINEEETRRAVELEKYFSVIPAFRAEYKEIKYDYPGILRQKVDRAYNSALEEPMTSDQLRRYLQRGGLLSNL